MAVAKTLRAIAYNSTPEKPAKADGYEAILETVRKQISLETLKACQL
jgi:hypothetical protein